MFASLDFPIRLIAFAEELYLALFLFRYTTFEAEF